MVMTRPGTLVISLDFELRWGVRDIYPRGEYDAWLLGGRKAIPRILALFEKYEIAATWATVGMLFARDRDELMEHLPDARPTYDDHNLDPYPVLDRIGADEKADPLSYAPSVLDRIISTPRQELGTHTFSHFYCVEPGQTVDQFAADLSAARAIGARYGEAHRSLVLPRNQWNSDYAEAAYRQGVRIYRVNRDHWAYAPAKSSEETPARRLFRLVDTYLPLSGRTTVPPPSEAFQRMRATAPLPTIASRFLRPWQPRFRSISGLQLARIQKDVERAAQTGSVFHLWWHPHNFGVHTEENLAVLESILRGFRRVSNDYGMKSLSMGALVPSAQSFESRSL